MNDDIDIDELVNELREGNAELMETRSKGLSAEQINQFILDKTSQIIENGMVALDSVQRQIITSNDSGAVESYGVLINSITSAMETINKINIQQIKQKFQKKIKKMDIESKEKIAENKLLSARENLQLPGGNVTNNNVLVTTREDFFKMLKEMDEPESPSAEKIIDVEG
jgi:RIO-like serine/threonine protein kinase